MAQLRHDYPEFKALNTRILLMVPNGTRTIERYLRDHPAPFEILTDKRAEVAGQYLQVRQFFSLGTPCVFLVDRTGCIRYTHYAKSMISEPDNREPLAVLAGLEGRHQDQLLR
jgi:peroxiredoxin